MKTTRVPFKTAQLVGVAALLAIGLLPAQPLHAAVPPAMETQLAALRTPEQKLAFLQQNAGGLSLKDKASLGASVIQSVPATKQKAFARQVAAILAAKGTDTAKLAALLVNDLPSKLMGSLAGSIAIGMGQTDPANLPQITSAVVTANATTIANAPSIAGEVTAASPLNRASAIASAIGATFIDQPVLAQEAPKIAASMVEAMLKEGTIEQVRPQAAQTVAALTALLPGTVNGNKELIIQVGKEVAAVISAKYPGLAPTIVGVTAETLKSSAGGSNVNDVLNGFADAFAAATGDPAIKAEIVAITKGVEQGTAQIDIKQLMNNIDDAKTAQGNSPAAVLPANPTSAGVTAPQPGSYFLWSPRPSGTESTTSSSTGSLTPHETPTTPI